MVLDKLKEKVEDVQIGINIVKRALEEPIRQIANNAHAITSQAALLGFSQLAELCTKLEQACLAGEDVMPLLEAVRGEARRACETIEWLSKAVA